MYRLPASAWKRTSPPVASTPPSHFAGAEVTSSTIAGPANPPTSAVPVSAQTPSKAPARATGTCG